MPEEKETAVELIDDALEFVKGYDDTGQWIISVGKDKFQVLIYSKNKGIKV